MPHELTEACGSEGCGKPVSTEPNAIKGACVDCIADGFCPARDDQTHCPHWWDGEEPCCGCGDNTPEKEVTDGA